jgi:hypothetical protein
VPSTEAKFIAVVREDNSLIANSRRPLTAIAIFHIIQGSVSKIPGSDGKRYCQFSIDFEDGTKFTVSLVTKHTLE